LFWGIERVMAKVFSAKAGTVRRLLLGSAVALLVLGACRSPAPDRPQPYPTAVAPTPAPSGLPAGDLSDAEARTLSSLTLVDPYPLYTMQYVAPYDAETAGALSPARGWSCSLFAALGDPSSRLYGRGFDWEYSPAVLLFTDPPDGYASVSMVDIAYLLSDLRAVASLHARTLEGRRELLRAPHLPFDGMNEHGLVVGMAAVPAGDAPFDPALPTVDDLELIRWMLDRARTVDEAVGVLRRANVSWGNGPPIHYLIADATGQAALVEYVQGEMVVLPNEEPWLLATNFFVSSAGVGPTAESGLCPRYDRMLDTLRPTGGILQVNQALELLRQVANDTTQWSVVYDLSQRSVHIAMGGKFETVYSFELRN
jgi:hypothetical protein